MYTRTFVLFLIFILYTFIVIFAIMCEKGRKRPEVFSRCSARACYLVLFSPQKAFCDFCLSGFVMVSYKAIILTFSLRMIFLRVADIERIKSHKGEISLWINSFLKAPYQPTGDQPQAIEALVKGFREGNQCQTLLGVTGSGKTFTMANVIQALNKPTLVIATIKHWPLSCMENSRDVP